MIDYSIIIRTTGKAHEKYQKLLDSIDGLEPQPKEIIVVLPEGTEIPDQQLGRETYFFSPKGMVIQRMTGIEHCMSQYALICDDDVVFEQDFVQKLYEPVGQGLCSFSAGPLYSFLPPKGVNALLCALIAIASPTFFHRDRYVSILRTSGYSYNRKLRSEKKYYETQSVAWTCFFADVSALRSIDFNSESWLDSHGYSALDDQTMFYKAWLRGIKTYIVVNAHYEHLDARTSIQNNKPAVLYSGTYNRVVFWHRFIYSQQPNAFLQKWAEICFAYKMFTGKMYDRLSVLRRKLTKEDYKISRKGYQDARQYIQSKEYRELPPVL